MYIAFVGLDTKRCLVQMSRDQTEVPASRIHTIRVLYTGTKAYVKGSKHPFDILVGCRQGALESPVLFNIYMDFVVRVARQAEKF